jgi:hypothetical protein
LRVTLALHIFGTFPLQKDLCQRYADYLAQASDLL